MVAGPATGSGWKGGDAVAAVRMRLNAGPFAAIFAGD